MKEKQSEEMAEAALNAEVKRFRDTEGSDAPISADIAGNVASGERPAKRWKAGDRVCFAHLLTKSYTVLRTYAGEEPNVELVGMSGVFASHLFVEAPEESEEAQVPVSANKAQAPAPVRGVPANENAGPADPRGDTGVVPSASPSNAEEKQEAPASMHARSGSSKTFHFRIDLAGALSHWNPQEWRECVRDGDGIMLTPRQVREKFQKLLDAGTRFIPVGSCDDFDPEHGCRGHRSPAPAIDLPPVTVEPRVKGEPANENAGLAIRLGVGGVPLEELLRRPDHSHDAWEKYRGRLVTCSHDRTQHIFGDACDGVIHLSERSVNREFQIDDLAKGAYGAYGLSTNNKNFRGEEMPKWDELPEAIRSAWKAAVKFVFEEVA